MKVLSRFFLLCFATLFILNTCCSIIQQVSAKGPFHQFLSSKRNKNSGKNTINNNNNLGRNPFQKQRKNNAKSGACPDRPHFPYSNQQKSAGIFNLELPQSVMSNIQSYMQNFTQAPCTPGAHSPSAPSFSGAVIFGNKTYFIQIGCTDVTRPTTSTPTPDTIYRLASVSKTFTVKMLLDAYEESGYIRSLDDAVSTYIPEFFVPNPYASADACAVSQQPTWRELASQQAGLPRDSPCSPLDCDMSLSEAIERIGQQQLLHSPWDAPSYSNFAFSFIGNALAERIYTNSNNFDNSGANHTTFDSLLQTLIVQKLGLSASTGTKYTDAVLKNLAVAYTPYGIADPPMDLHFDTPAGGIFSSARDLAKWLNMWIGKFRDSPSYRQTMQPTYIDGSLNTGWATPWELFETSPEFGYVVRGKDGYLPGICSYIAMIPEMEIGFVGLWNGEGFDTSGAGAYAIDQILQVAFPMLVAANEEAQFLPVPSVEFLNDGWLGTYGIQLSLDILHATISYDSNKKRLRMAVPGFGTFWLKPSPLQQNSSSNQFAYQIYDPSQNYQNCQSQAFAAYNNEVVYFSINNATGKKELFVPGYVYFKFVQY